MLAVAVAEQVYQYLAPSEVRSLDGRTDVLLATSGGNVEGQPVRQADVRRRLAVSQGQRRMAWPEEGGVLLDNQIDLST